MEILTLNCATPSSSNPPPRARIFAPYKTNLIFLVLFVHLRHARPTTPGSGEREDGVEKSTATSIFAQLLDGEFSHPFQDAKPKWL
jgi:hypothetical protein